MGHLGPAKTFSFLERRLWWPGMRTAVREHICVCRRCLHFKTPPSLAPLQPITASFPMQLVHLDYLKIEGSDDAYRSILVVTNHFSGFAQAHLVRNESAAATARILDQHLFDLFGYPEVILTDQGASFRSACLLYTSPSPRDA